MTQDKRQQRSLNSCTDREEIQSLSPSFTTYATRRKTTKNNWTDGKTEHKHNELPKTKENKDKKTNGQTKNKYNFCQLFLQVTT